MSTWYDLCAMSYGQLNVDELKCQCPICDKTMLLGSSYSSNATFTLFKTTGSFYKGYRTHCSNNCFCVDFWVDQTAAKVDNREAILMISRFKISIFGEQVYNHSKTNKMSLKEDLKPVIEKIEYWREDYRYIAELLERG